MLDKLLVFKVMIASTQGQGHVWSMKDVSHVYRMRKTVPWEVLSPKMRWQLDEVIAAAGKKKKKE